MYDNDYTIRGYVDMIDIYGNVWRNDFDCIMKYDDIECDDWEATDFEYTSSSWKKLEKTQ